MFESREVHICNIGACPVGMSLSSSRQSQDCEAIAGAIQILLYQTVKCRDKDELHGQPGRSSIGSNIDFQYDEGTNGSNLVHHADRKRLRYQEILGS